jgi:catechol 2,3-dioxygenase-like lactoylglutathione lyase family enzyme
MSFEDGLWHSAIVYTPSMRAAIVAAVFVAGFISGQITQAQQSKEAPALPAERVSGIGGIFIKAKDPKTLGLWYSDKLGVPRPEGPVPPLFLWRERDDPNLVGTTVWGLFRADTKYFEPSQSSYMINYRVRNLDRMLAQLRAQGVRVDTKVIDDFNGRFAWVMDPEGNKIELWEPKAGF